MAVVVVGAVSASSRIPAHTARSSTHASALIAVGTGAVRAEIASVSNGIRGRAVKFLIRVLALTVEVMAIAMVGAVSVNKGILVHIAKLSGAYGRSMATHIRTAMLVLIVLSWSLMVLRQHV
jgi:hypothetical protein